MDYKRIKEGKKYNNCFNGHLPGQPKQAGTRMSPFWILFELRRRTWWWQSSSQI